MKLDTHGLKIKGIKDACAATQDYGYGPGMTEIIYNRSTGEIRTKYFVDKNSWTAVEYPECTVAHTSEHMTMQQIADAIYYRVQELRDPK